MRDVLVALTGFAFFGAAIVGIVQLFRKKWKVVGICAGVAVVALVVDAVSQPSSTSGSFAAGFKAGLEGNGTAAPSRSNGSQGPARSTPHHPSPKPTSYGQFVLGQKRAFLAAVNESITAPMIEGNKYRYVGKKVDLHCSVENTPDQSWFNATCGEDADGTDAVIVIEYNTHDLSPGQAVRVLRTVDQPMQGSNAMGGDSTFPTVKAAFME